jgi:transposase
MSGSREEVPTMQIAYPRAIIESVAALQARERHLRGTPAAPRIQMLRLLKSQEATTLPAVAVLVGYSPRHVQRWWQTYRTAGLVALEQVYHPAGKPAQLTEEAWAGLVVELEAGRIAGQEDARRYLAKQWGVRYASVNGISYQFKQRKVKWKTGRRRHAKADAAAQAAFSQTSPPH